MIVCLSDISVFIQFDQSTAALDEQKGTISRMKQQAVGRDNTISAQHKSIANLNRQMGAINGTIADQSTAIKAQGTLQQKQKKAVSALTKQINVNEQKRAHDSRAARKEVECLLGDYLWTFHSINVMFYGFPSSLEMRRL